ncbi:DUF2931 family protein [Pseudomonas frederiksbergensis]|uniref:DUF2931 family protein n=1 Tax=Pseudomonas frederiksbergensis TaxID=104087 RepID=UPI003D198094
MRAMLALLGAILISGCQSGDPLSAKNDPKSQWWELAFIEPNYMNVWMENSSVQDVTGKVFFRTGSGTAAGGEPEDGKESARGWVGVGGSGRTVVGADLPMRIFVRWQSIVEQKTYRAWVDIPQQARLLMVSSTQQRCPQTPEREARFMASVYLGLAPGGVVQVWMKDSCYRPIKVARAQAEIEPLGPDQGKNEGRYAYPVSEKSKRYINQYGIPYGSW